VERWFSELTSKRIRRETFRNVPDLITAIEEFTDTWNRNPKPFVWTATAGFDRGETATVPANPQKHPAGMQPAAFTEKEEKITPVV
jgi:hypothetical protein